MKLVVRELNQGDEKAFFAGLKEWEGESLHWHSFIWKPGMTYQEMLVILARQAAGIDLAPGRVPHTMFYGFLDQQIIGRVSVRHQLNDDLRKRGGHLGYAVAKKFRQQGYGAQLAEYGVSYCKKLGLPSILVTCGEDNLPSRKIIERLGGTREQQYWDEDNNEMVLKYQIKF